MDETADSQGTMDNRLARLHDRIWLAGFVDADGTISCANCPRKGKDRARPMIRIGNTNPRLIEECLRILDQEGIKNYVYTQQPKPHHKIATIITIGRMDMVKRFASLLRRHLRGKRGQAELIYRFVSSRIKRRRDTRYNAPYNKEEYEWMEQMKKLNHKGVRDRTASG